MATPSIFRILEMPWVFRLSQKLGKPTLDLYEGQVRDNVSPRPEERVLEIGCGFGAHRKLFNCQYLGTDINSRYIELANQRNAQPRNGADFQAMDCTRLTLPDQSFDQVVSIATFHHLSDEQVTLALQEAFRVLKSGGKAHIIDPVFPVDGSHGIKHLLFRMDRGQFPRTLAQHEALLSRCGSIEHRDIRVGPRHDVTYFRLSPKN